MPDPKQFESDVLHIARSLWDQSHLSGALMIDGHERDGVFITEYVIHVVEATTSGQKQYIAAKCPKIVRLLKSLAIEHPNKAMQGWLITHNEPTGDQRAESKKYSSVNLLSFDSFRKKLIDAATYIRSRSEYPFGSARNTVDGKDKKLDTYIHPQLVNLSTREQTKINKIVSHLISDNMNYVILGDYGVGKSMAMREIYQQLIGNFFKSTLNRFPILLNLRDHQGQDEPEEALERHARKVGYPSPDHLVRAWRSGYAVLLLDGFDELAAQGWSTSSKKLKDVRHRAMALVRKFSQETTSGFLITGRRNYFDKTDELITALGLQTASHGRSRQCTLLALNDFSMEEVRHYLVKHNWEGEFPDWLPSKPFLLSYLVNSGLLKNILTTENGLSSAEGWNHLLDGISQREAQIEPGIDQDAVRSIIERLATMARTKHDDSGKLSYDEFIQAFTHVCGYQPDERGLGLLQRLPGFGSAEGDESSRVLIDRDFADAAQSGEVVKYISRPFQQTDIHHPQDLAYCLGELGCQVVANKCAALGLTAGNFMTAAKQAQKASAPTLAADIVRSYQMASLRSNTMQALTVEGIVAAQWTFTGDMPNLSFLTVLNSIVNEIQIESTTDLQMLPIFQDCLFSQVSGCASHTDLNPAKFINCEVRTFITTASNTSQLMSSAIPLSCRVLLTILEKLYLQPGSGRIEDALYRGIGPREKNYVAACLGILSRHKFAYSASRSAITVWHPVRARTAEVKSILTAPMTNMCDAIKEASLLE